MAAPIIVGSRTNAMETGSGETILEPQGKHTATMVWLHDNDDKSSKSLEIVKSLHPDKIKWICLDTGIRRVDLGVGSTTFYTVGSPTFQADLAELESVADRVANKLLTEKDQNVIKGVGGIGIGAQVALHFATKCALGHYPINLRLVIAINGWLFTWRSIKSSIESTPGAATRAGSQSILLTREKSDYVLTASSYENTNLDSLREAGFGDITLIPFAVIKNQLYKNPELLSHEINAWLKDKALSPRPSVSPSLSK